MPNQAKKKIAGTRNHTRRNGKASKQAPIRPCTRDDHTADVPCKRHPLKTQGGRSPRAWRRHLQNVDRNVAMEEPV